MAVLMCRLCSAVFTPSAAPGGERVGSWVGWVRGGGGRGRKKGEERGRIPLRPSNQNRSKRKIFSHHPRPSSPGKHREMEAGVNKLQLECASPGSRARVCTGGCFEGAKGEKGGDTVGSKHVRTACEGTCEKVRPREGARARAVWVGEAPRPSTSRPTPSKARTQRRGLQSKQHAGRGSGAGAACELRCRGYAAG
ncbi:hypothetical protein C8F04DRAFT_736006 [Mycena alexandri]|uniref:Uncharacterized protein n=1 Tax=Mycena alexandri TaxID=1745969 RepID=A0AAD6RV44_9AGAR|nr:hypothetical protein C8F04DRAFT_736006 [Mycena alexandri]